MSPSRSSAFNPPTAEEMAALRAENAELRQQLQQYQLAGQAMQDPQAYDHGEAYLRVLMRYSFDVIVIVTADGIRRFVSPSVEQMLGYKPEDLVGENTLKHVHPEDISKAEAAFSRAVQQPDQPIRVELRFRHLNGQWIDLEVVGTNLLHHPGINGVVVNLRDICERKQAERALHKSEALLRAIFDYSAAGIAVSDLTGRLIKTNPAYQQMLGYSQAALLEMDFCNLIHEVDRDKNQAYFTSLVEGQQDSFQLETRCRRQDNHIIWVRNTVSLIPTEKGQPKLVLAIVENITERKQAKKTLQQQQRFLRTVIDTAPSLIFVKDWDGRYLLANQAMADFYDTTVEELIGQVEADLQANPAIAAQFTRENQQIIKTLQPLFIAEEKSASSPDSGDEWLQWQKHPIYLPESGTYGVLGIGIKITARKRAEAALQKLNQELELRVQKRTQELEQSQAILRQREQEFRTLVEHSPDVICRIDRDFRYSYINPEADRRGIFAATLVGQTLQASQLSAEQIALWQESIQQVFQTGKEQVLESSIHVPEGVLHYQTRIVPEFNQAGAVVSVLAVARDISALKQTEAALRASEELFRKVFDDAPIAISLIALDGFKLAQRNAVHREMFGYSDTELSAMSLVDFTHPEDIENDLQQIQNLIDGSIPRFQIEKRFIKRNGDVMWTNLTATLIRDHNGKPRYSMGMIEDITARKLAEEQLKTSLKEQEVLLKEIHHRVKNNLQTVSSLLALQMSSIQDPEILAPFKESQNRVKVMALIHEKLYQSSSLAQINLAAYIRKLAMDLLYSYNAPSAIQLHIDVPEIELPLDAVIPCGLIINELVSNAIKYAFPEGRSGQVNILFSQLDANQYTLVVQDNGVGVPATVDFQTTKSLGLRLVHAFSRKLRGTLELDRSSGSAFKITFSR